MFSRTVHNVDVVVLCTSIMIVKCVEITFTVLLTSFKCNSSGHYGPNSRKKKGGVDIRPTPLVGRSYSNGRVGHTRIDSVCSIAFKELLYISFFLSSSSVHLLENCDYESFSLVLAFICTASLGRVLL